MKYIVNKCPSLRNYDVFGNPNKGCCYNYMCYCKDVVDCNMKQLLEQLNHDGILELMKVEVKDE